MSGWPRSARLTALAMATLASWPAAAEEERAPAPALALRDLNGKQVSLADLRGKVVVVSLWASWCGPCKQELKHLDALYRRLKGQGLVVLAVSTDGPETQADVRGTVRQARWQMPVLVDRDGAAMARLNPRGTVPFTLFVDRRGRQAQRHEGYTAGDEKTYGPLIEKLLAEPTP